MGAGYTHAQLLVTYACFVLVFFVFGRERERERDWEVERSRLTEPLSFNRTLTQGLKINGQKVFHLAYAACLRLLVSPQLALLRESQCTWVYSPLAHPMLGLDAPQLADGNAHLSVGSWSPLHVVRLGFRAPQ